MVTVLSMLAVATQRGSASLQSNDVMGAQNSLHLLLLSSFSSTTPSSVMRHRRKKSPDVASKSWREQS